MLRRKSVDEKQPAVSARGDLVLVYEGLIDNADEIRRRARLVEPSGHRQDGCDGHSPGVRAVAGRVPGASVWRLRLRHLGSRPKALLLRPRPNRHQALLLPPRRSAVRVRLRNCGNCCSIRTSARIRTKDDGREYLSNYIVSVDETLYRDIRRLPAGHSLAVSAEQHSCAGTGSSIPAGVSVFAPTRSTAKRFAERFARPSAHAGAERAAVAWS